MIDFKSMSDSQFCALVLALPKEERNEIVKEFKESGWISDKAREELKALLSKVDGVDTDLLSKNLGDNYNCVLELFYSILRSNNPLISALFAILLEKVLCPNVRTIETLISACGKKEEAHDHA